MSFLITLAVGRSVGEIIVGSWPGRLYGRMSGCTGIGTFSGLGRSLYETSIGTSLTPARAAAFSRQLHYEKLEIRQHNKNGSKAYSLVLLLVLFASSVLAGLDVVLLLSLRTRLLLLWQVGGGVHVQVKDHLHGPTLL